MAGANGNGKKNGNGKQVAGPVAPNGNGKAMPAVIPQPHGGALLAGGMPGNKGGRPPDLFKRRMRAAATYGAKQAYLAKCLRGDEGPQAYISAMRFCAEHGYGKPQEHVEHGGTIGLRIEVVRP